MQYTNHLKGQRPSDLVPNFNSTCINFKFDCGPGPKYYFNFFFDDLLTGRNLTVMIF
jgi:hypothetical protein